MTEREEGETEMFHVEHEPEAAHVIAGEQIEKLRLFAKNLAEHGETLGLIGPKELPRLWTRHILNSAILAPIFSEDAKVADIGTGGGMPGLILAIVRPDLHVRCIEPMERRCDWLNAQKKELKLDNMEVLRGRAEEFHDAFHVDYVTARAVSALSKLIPITAPLLKNGGELSFLKGMSVENEITAAKKQIKKFRLNDIKIDILGEDLLTETTRVFRATVGAVES